MNHHPTSCSCHAAHLHALHASEALEPRPKGILSRLFVGMVRFYQKRISPLTPPACRFSPTCSEYTRQAILKYGAFKGTRLGVQRILRCHPFNPGGHDPVP